MTALAFLLWFVPIQVLGQSAILYVYDDLGRLIAVVDSNSDTATYAYDAVGNLLSIDRYSSSQVSIISVSPGSGPVGTTVTIVGTGFSTTPSQNTVTFNSTGATVATATATQLVVTVPSGATTGAIAVTAPAGSATSGSSFVVAANPGAPTISSVSPSIGVAGASVAVSGTNFSSSTTNERVILNTHFATISSPTTTSFNATIPALTGSGRLTVSTAAGTGVSANDVFVPPSPFLASDVQFTDRTTIGSSKLVTISTATKIGMVTFDGTSGQRVSMTATGSTLASAAASLLRPDNTTLASTSFSSGYTGFVDTQTLLATGTYTLLLDPSSANTGSATLNVHNVSDVSGSIVAGGSAVAVSLPTPGQRALLTFSGTSNQRVSLKASSNTIGSLSTMAILKPDGSTLASTTFSSGYTGFVDTQTLPSTGTYTVLLDPSGANTGGVTLILYNVSDVTGSITAGGSGVAVSLTTPGQKALLTFSGTSNQRVSLKASSNTIASYTTMAILKPDGSTLASMYVYSNYTILLEPPLLPSTGTYTVLLDPSVENTGDVTLTLYDVSDVTGSITAGGSGVAVSLPTPGQKALLTFSGTSNQRVSLKASSNTIANSTMTILNPDGSTLASMYVYSNYTNLLESPLLPSTGTYTVRLDPNDANTGGVTLTLYTVSDVTGSIEAGGSGVAVSLTIPGQKALLTFSGTSNQRVSLKASSNTIANSNMAILKPDGSTLASMTVYSGYTNLLEPPLLPSTGTYTVRLDPPEANTGGATLTLYDVVDASSSVTIGGSAATVTIGTPGQNGSVTFSGTASQQATVHVTSNTIANVTVKLLKPDGSQLTTTTSSSSSFNLSTQTLPTTSTYTIRVDPPEANTGSVNVSVTSP